jgi:hypothetical protein
MCRRFSYRRWRRSDAVMAVELDTDVVIVQLHITEGALAAVNA